MSKRERPVKKMRTPDVAPGGRRKRGASKRRYGSPWLVTAGIVIVGVVLLVGMNLAKRAPRNAGAAGALGARVEVSLDRGQQLYDANCASCHGANGGGYASRDTPAPALNGSEHSWHHSDSQILALMREGGFQMPAVGADWSEDDLASVLAYVKQWWAPAQRRAQQGTIGE